MVNDEKEDDGMRTLARELERNLERAHYANEKLMSTNVRAAEQYVTYTALFLDLQRRASRFEVALEAIAAGHILPDSVRHHARAALERDGCEVD